ncbi:MAG: exopolyphosphatase [Gammaproteobacteria bacterium]|nr:exopolyphosphatase [Gammaproteobacteria bacterium]MBU1601702.1 exopolyphosphatase [Gammaproteobacteria bacterium]MBU2434781.1 exopolyphosphatase [Gammaproteobacteria bacterium]MBU2448022.1 exopolyphosphatase [Gammaproteobacteria bacterium]
MIYETVAAVDLGSNSFRLQVGRVVDNQIYTLDSMKEPVRLASGLMPDKRLDVAAQGRALDALRRFGERLGGLDRGAVRAVATNTLRIAKNAFDFLPQAEEALGFPIEVIAGREEARLIYIGASHSLPSAAHKRLVIDIGGGSTEFIIGKRHEPQLMESLYMGCVSYTLRFFPDRRIDRKRLREAQVAAAKEIELIAHDYQRVGWKEAIGSSGSARAIADVLELNGLNPNNESGITRVGLERLCTLLVKAGSAEALDLPGVKGDRLPVFPGGVAIMSAIFEELGIERMTYADGALRLGVLYDLLGRFHHHDMRDSTVAQFRRRYQVEGDQVARVEATALAALTQLYDGAPGEADIQFLAWACRLHEIGISVAHNAYHKHGAYILTYADMPGFSKKDQARLAMVVLGHRGKLEKLGAIPALDSAWDLIFCLRLAVLLHRTRDDRAIPAWRASRKDNGYNVELPAEWLATNPWTAAAFGEEASVWKQLGREYTLQSKTQRKIA